MPFILLSARGTNRTDVTCCRAMRWSLSACMNVLLTRGMSVPCHAIWCSFACGRSGRGRQSEPSTPSRWHAPAAALWAPRLDTVAGPSLSLPSRVGYASVAGAGLPAARGALCPLEGSDLGLAVGTKRDASRAYPRRRGGDPAVCRDGMGDPAA